MEVDLGCGKGRFLLAHAAAHPDINLLGTDIQVGRLQKVRTRAERAGLANIRLLHTDTDYVLEYLIPRDSIRTFYLFFPDPWPKRRHAKRRMFRDVSAEQFARTLVPDGRLIMKTDVPVSFIRIRRVMRDSHLFDLEEMRVWRGPSPLEDNIPTNFETKYARIGKEVFYARWKVKK